MSRQHPDPARTASRRLHGPHSPLTIAAVALLPPLLVVVLSYPLTAMAALLAPLVATAVARWLVPRVTARAEGRRTSLPLPGLGLRLELGLADE